MNVPYLKLVPLPKKGLTDEPKIGKLNLFRGKTIPTDPDTESVWVYGDLSQTKVTLDEIVSSESVFISHQVTIGTSTVIVVTPVYPETVGQYINCNDDNNKTPIFDDDIVETELSAGEGYQYLVVWEDEGFYFEPFSRDGEVPEEEDHLHEWGFISSPGNGRIQVVGNIHDNPELLPITKEEEPE